MIRLAAALHVCWGASILLAGSVPITSAALVDRLLPWGRWVGLVYLLGAALALWAIIVREARWGPLLLMLQQTLLLLAALSAIDAIVLGRYADGTVVSRAHLFADQVIFPLLAIGHGWELLRPSRGWRG